MSTQLVTYNDAINNKIPRFGVSSPRIAVIIPAHNEEESISDVLKSLAEQSLPKDLELDIFLSLDNCSDQTKQVATRVNGELGLNLFLYETVNNKQRKVGAMNQIYQLFWGDLNDPNHEVFGKQHQNYVESIVAFIGIDADVYLDRDCIKTLWNELQYDHKIGAVSANYTSLLPDSSHQLSKHDPNREHLIRSGKYGNAINRWFGFAQNLEFTSWTIKQKYNGHIAEICGGQCSIFRPKALKEVCDHFKLNGVYSDESDTEDLRLTQDLRSCGWVCLISKNARCYVDSMKNLHSYLAQRNKWVSGTIDYMLEAGVSTKYSRRLWLQETNLMINLLIRFMFIGLTGAAVLTHQFQWNWLWISPVVAASLLNLILSIRTPNSRFIDVLLSTFLITPEIYLWITLYVHIEVWISRFRINKKDGWQAQYMAESGQSHSHFLSGIFILLLVISSVVGLVYWKYDYITSDAIQKAAQPYLIQGFVLLTWLTIFEFLIMVAQIWRLRAPYKA